MKKLLLFNLLLIVCVFVKAQTIDVMLDGAAFSMTSPRGNYLAGNMSDYAAYYNVATKTIKHLEGDVQDDGGCFVWDINDLGQLAVDWRSQAAIWSEASGFELLPLPEGLTSKEKRYSAARCISNDGKYVVVSFGSPTVSIYLYTKGDDGIYTMEKMSLPEIDPIYNQIPQYIAPCGMTDDGNRILCRYRVKTGEFELPFVMERTSGGDWSIRWIAPDFIVNGGKTDAIYPGDEFEFDGDPFADPEGFDAARNELLQKQEDYYAVIESVSTGYFYSGEKGDLSGLEMSANGKYAKMNISYKENMSNENAMVSNYPAVIDLETEQVYVFTCLSDAACLSVTNDGVISMTTPKLDYFRYAHISSIADPTKLQTLTEWTKEKTNGKINLVDYMTYETYEGTKVAEGSAILFADGSGFMTNQYNGFGDNQRFETYVVDFGNVEGEDEEDGVQARQMYVGNLKFEDNFRQTGVVQNDDTISAAVFVSAEELTNMVGAELQSVSLYKHENAKIAYLKVFVTESLDSISLFEKEVDVTTLVDGWNLVALDDNLVLDGDSLYLGYSLKSQATISQAVSNSSPVKSFIQRGSSAEWTATKGIAVYGTIVGDNLPAYDIVLSSAVESIDVEMNKPVDFSFFVENVAADTIRTIEIECDFGNGKKETKTIEVEIPYLASDSIVFDGLAFEELGMYDVEFTITKLNGNDDLTPENNVHAVKVTVIERIVKRKVLFEIFSTENSTYSSQGHEIIESSIDGRNDEIIAVDHHVGFYTDQWTLPADTIYMNFYYSAIVTTFTPAGMIDRTLFSKADGHKNPYQGGDSCVIFSITAADVRNMLSVQLAKPAYAWIDLDATFNENDSILTIKASGKSVTNLLGDSRLTIYVTEDSLLSYKQAGWNSDLNGPYYQNNVNRFIVTDVWGDQVTLNEGFEKEYKVKVQPNWNVDNLNVVAFVHNYSTKPNEKERYTDFNVYNAEKVKITMVDTEKVNENFALYVASENPEMGGVKIILVAEAIEGFEFVEWSDGNTSNPRIIELTEDTELYACFRIKDISVNIDTSKISSVNVYANNGILYVDGVETDYHVLDAAGRLIYTGRNAQLSLPRGVYMIAVDGEVQKVIL